MTAGDTIDQIPSAECFSAMIREAQGRHAKTAFATAPAIGTKFCDSNGDLWTVRTYGLGLNLAIGRVVIRRDRDNYGLLFPVGDFPAPQDNAEAQEAR